MEQKFFSKLSSDTISALRFPLMIGIVFIHNEALNEPVVQSLGFREGLPYWLFCIYSLFTNVLPRIGVPLFFLISGYLFFCSGLTKDSYKSKLRRRIKTLLVPYIIWDILAFTYKNFLTGAGTFDLTDAIEIVKIFFIYPQDRPMWYVRNLMFATLVSPIYYVYVKKSRHWGVGLLGIVWIIADDTKGILYSSQILSTSFFFSWGAYNAINGKDFVSSLSKYQFATYFYIPIAIIDLLTKGYEYNGYIHKVGIIFGIIAAVSLIKSLLDKRKIGVSKFLVDSSFFLFAAHWIIIADVTKLIVKIYFVKSYLYMTFLYFLVSTITIVICLAIYWLLQRFSPRFCALLTGGR